MAPKPRTRRSARQPLAMFKSLGQAAAGAAGKIAGQVVGAVENAVPEVQQMAAPVPVGFPGVAQLIREHQSLTMTQTSGGDCDCAQVCCCCCNNCCNECKGEHGGPGFPCCCIRGGNTYTVEDARGRTVLDIVEDTKPEGCRAGERCCCSACSSTIFYFKEPGADGKILMSVEREGLSNGKCVCCFSICDCCNDKLQVYEGEVIGLPGELQNAPKMVSMLEQPCGGGGFVPTLDIKPAQGSGGSEMQVHGPLCFGGCMALCCKSDFQVDKSEDDGAAGSLGVIQHLAPKTCCEVCCTFCGGLHKYTVGYKDGAADEDRVNMLIGSLLVDLVYFQIDQGPCNMDQDYIYINLFNCNCCGCVCPFKCCIKNFMCDSD